MMKKNILIIDIGSKDSGLEEELTNFQLRRFIFNNVECNSMEGLLQSPKFDKQHIQVEVCKLVGIQAKRRGQKKNKAWKSRQTLWWKGKAFARNIKNFLIKFSQTIPKTKKSKQRLLLPIMHS